MSKNKKIKDILLIILSIGVVCLLIGFIVVLNDKKNIDDEKKISKKEYEILENKDKKDGSNFEFKFDGKETFRKEKIIKVSNDFHKSQYKIEKLKKIFKILKKVKDERDE